MTGSVAGGEPPRMRDRVAIVGAALAEIGTPAVEERWSSHALAAQAGWRAVRDAGLDMSEIDGICTCGFGMDSTLEVADYLGLRDLGYVNGSCVGGATWASYVEHAAAAIDAGLCRNVLITHGAMAYTDRRRPLHIWSDARAPIEAFDHYAGNSFVTAYALLAQRYLWEYGLDASALAEVAVSTREWAALNPLARFREPLTVDQVLDSPMISSPLRLLDCCLISDGGAALVVTSRERASETRAPVIVAGAGSAQGHLSLAQMPNLTRTPSDRSGARAFATAGLGPTDVDLLMLYDAFTIVPILALEDLGFCGRGEAPGLVASGATRPGGHLPMNTNGGGLSFAHTGMYGIFTLVEAVQQLRAEAGDRQVADCEVALAHAVGEFFSATATVILRRA